MGSGVGFCTSDFNHHYFYLALAWPFKSFWNDWPISKTLLWELKNRSAQQQSLIQTRPMLTLVSLTVHFIILRRPLLISLPVSQWTVQKHFTANFVLSTQSDDTAGEDNILTTSDNAVCLLTTINQFWRIPLKNTYWGLPEEWKGTQSLRCLLLQRRPGHCFVYETESSCRSASKTWTQNLCL